MSEAIEIPQALKPVAFPVQIGEDYKSCIDVIRKKDIDYKITYSLERTGRFGDSTKQNWVVYGGYVSKARLAHLVGHHLLFLNMRSDGAKEAFQRDQAALLSLRDPGLKQLVVDFLQRAEVRAAAATSKPTMRAAFPVTISVGDADCVVLYGYDGHNYKFSCLLNDGAMSNEFEANPVVLGWVLNGYIRSKGAGIFAAGEVSKWFGLWPEELPRLYNLPMDTAICAQVVKQLTAYVGDARVVYGIYYQMGSNAAGTPFDPYDL